MQQIHDLQVGGAWDLSWLAGIMAAAIAIRQRTGKAMS
jgi:hypothetical protein